MTTRKIKARAPKAPVQSAPVATVTVSPIPKAAIPSAPATKGAKAASAVAASMFASAASRFVLAAVASEGGIADAASVFASARLSQLDTLEASLEGAGVITAAVWTEHFQEPLMEAFKASGRYEAGADGKYRGAVSAASAFKVAAMAMTAPYAVKKGEPASRGFPRIAEDTKLRDYVARARPWLIGQGAIPAGQGGSGGKGRKGKGDAPNAGVTGQSVAPPENPMVARMEAAALLCDGDKALTVALVTATATAEARASLAMLLQMLNGAAQGRPAK